MGKNFEEWLQTFRQSIASYKYYIDFEKVKSNVDSIKIELNILNSLIGSKNIEEDFIKLVSKYPEVLKCIPILIAVRGREIHAEDFDGAYNYVFDERLKPKDAARFMDKTGLFDLMSNFLVKDLVDYVTGVETGLDSNGRKNRGGHLMEDMVEAFIKDAGFVKGETYFKEMRTDELQEKFDLDLSGLTNDNKTIKRFDFVLVTDKTVYGLETNFYSGGGSKLNETARSYKSLIESAKSIDGFDFIWITDGQGWTSARNNLEETFDVGELVYNLDDLENKEVLKSVRKE